MRHFFIALFALLAAPVPADITATTATQLSQLTSTLPCNRCTGWLLPGQIVQHPQTRWGIISDLPESFRGYGVLYSTTEDLPPNGGSPDLLRQRRAQGFRSVDGGFDVFLFHLLKETTASARIVVMAKNLGTRPVTLAPRQVIKTEGVIGRVHEFESTLALRVLMNDWDKPVPQVTLNPKMVTVVGFSRQFGNVQPGPDASRNVNCFGYVRVLTPDADEQTSLEVYVVAIPAGPIERMAQDAASLLARGALSTDEVPLDSEPTGCALKRAVGVYPNFIWRNHPITLDLNDLPTSTIRFPMGLPKIQTAGCEQARQTQNLVLRPGYTREDTIGNYMIENHVTLTFTNTGSATRSVEVLFGKDEADIGLAYQAVAHAEPPGDPFAGVPGKWKWAGPKQATREAAFLDKPIELAPGAQQTLSLRSMVVGNSSLPYNLIVRSAGVGEVQQ